MTIHHPHRTSTRVQSGKRLLDAPLLVHARHAAWPAFLILAFLIPNVRGSAAEPTYYGQILRMMQTKCIKCHHDGGVGVTNYQNYVEVEFYKVGIRAQVLARTMPPWNASPEPSQGFPSGQGFLPNNELTQDQINLMVAWVDANAPAGDIADAPPELVFNDEWIQGTPDVIIEMPVAWNHPEGGDKYRCFLMEPTVSGALDQDEVVIGFEVKPSNLIIAHHAVVYIADRAAAEAAQAADSTPDPNDGWDCFGGAGVSASVLQGWAPGGNSVPLLNENLGVALPASKVIINQMHYHNDGMGEQIDRTQIGLKLSSDPGSVLLVNNIIPTTLPGVNGAAWPCLSGPAAGRNGGFGPMMPGEINTYRMPYPFSGSILVDKHLVSVFPHMHLIGSSFNVTASHASFPGGQIKIIDLDKWDFDWQLSYNFKQPIALPAGTVLEIQGTYFNNSGGDVIGGLFSNQEMLTLGMSMTTDSVGIPTPRDSTPPQVVDFPLPLLGPSYMMLVVEFDEDITLPHYPSGFEITGPGGRVAPPTSIEAEASTGMLVIDYDPLLLFPIAEAWVNLTVPMPVTHQLLLNGFFGIKDLNENFLDGNGNGVANELNGAISLDDRTFDFSWSGPELGTEEDPFSTLEGALLAVDDGGTLRILSGSTSETLIINQSVTLVTNGGLVSIGGA